MEAETWAALFGAVGAIVSAGLAARAVKLTKLSQEEDARQAALVKEMRNRLAHSGQVNLVTPTVDRAVEGALLEALSERATTLARADEAAR